MVSSKKRVRQEIEVVEPPEGPTLLDSLRNMWQFANLAQWIFIFGKAVKIDENIDIEELETECLKPSSSVLSDIGLALLKFVSSHRGLTHDIFDEYTRRQYVAKAPDRNPFGTDEIPAKFSEFDIFIKIRVLQQLTQWTMGNPDRIREKMEEQRDVDQTYWRVEPFGWDSEDRTYFVLDDNRLYRQTDPPPPVPPPAPKKNTKKAKAALRASKRRKVSEAAISEEELMNDDVGHDKGLSQMEDDGLGGVKWECVAVTLNDINDFLITIEKSRDPNEKILRKRIIEDLLPLLEKQEEARRRKVAQKEKELLNLERLATAKRSSRIAGKLEQQRQEEEAREAERKRQAELTMAKREREKWTKLERERESRMMTREQRLREREARRILHEEELSNLSEDSKKLESGQSRLSERHLKAEIEKKKLALEELADEEDDWVFDCICGAYGQIDDGTHSISCEKCNIWQHTKCVGVSEAEADGEAFHFICTTCKCRAEEVQRKNRPTIKFKLNRPGSSSSATSPHDINGSPSGTHGPIVNGSPSLTRSPQKSSPFYQASLPRPTYDSPYSDKPSGLTQAQTSPTDHSNTTTAPSQTEDGSPRFILSSHINDSSSTRSLNPQSPYSNGQNAPSATTNGSLELLSPSILPIQTNGSVSSNTSGVPADSHTFSQPPPQPTADDRYHTPRVQIQNRVQADQIRRSSISLPSPLAGAPVLSPYTDRSPKNSNSTPSQNSQSTTQQPLAVGLAQRSSSMDVDQAQPSKSEPTHEYFLPPAASGISPTKHSPPQSNAACNTGLSATTTSILPPIAPLSPNRPQTDPTSPVKPATPREGN